VSVKSLFLSIGLTVVAIVVATYLSRQYGLRLGPMHWILISVGLTVGVNAVLRWLRRR
jgi:hypothetical protein